MIKCGLTKLIDILSYALFNINKSKSTMNNKKGHKK